MLSSPSVLPWNGLQAWCNNCSAVCATGQIDMKPECSPPPDEPFHQVNLQHSSDRLLSVPPLLSSSHVTDVWLLRVRCPDDGWDLYYSPCPHSHPSARSLYPSPSLSLFFNISLCLLPGCASGSSRLWPLRSPGALPPRMATFGKLAHTPSSLSLSPRFLSLIYLSGAERAAGVEGWHIMGTSHGQGYPCDIPLQLRDPVTKASAARS